MFIYLTNYLTTSYNMFNITSGALRVNAGLANYDSEAFALTLFNNGESSKASLCINNTSDFYHFGTTSDTEYKVTALKIGDTTLSDTDLADGTQIVHSIPNSNGNLIGAEINANMTKDWVQKVYKQCTGKELIAAVSQPSTESLTPLAADTLLQSERLEYLGQQIAERLYEGQTVKNEMINNYIGDNISPFFKTLSTDKQTEFKNSGLFFITSYETNTTGLKTDNLVQNYFTVLKQFQDQYANDSTATSILTKYNPLANDDFKTAITTTINPDMFKIIYNIDPSNTYGFTSSLNGGLAYVLWLFYAYYIVIVLVTANADVFTPDTPIISSIPVSITFTNVTQ